MTQLVVEKIALLHVKLSIKLVIKTSWFVMKRPFVGKLFHFQNSNENKYLKWKIEIPCPFPTFPACF